MMEATMAKRLAFWDDLVRFCQRLIQTPSVSGQEGEVARIIQEEMKKLGYDEVWRDRVGNVIGLLKGDSSKPSVCFTGHMDTVPPGDESRWDYPPFSGAIAEGYIHGRGAGDMKGSLATQIYIPAVLREFGIANGEIGSVYVIDVVQEEKGGLGSMYLDKSIKKEIDYAINGEPTSNMINTGQRGRSEFIVTFKGKSAHASRPWEGINPFYDMARFLLKLDDLEMANYGDLKSTVVPTICKTDTETSNVIPSECTLILDWRDVPGESDVQILNKIKSILPDNGMVHLSEYDLETYTGLTLRMKRRKLPFSVDKGHPEVEAIAEAVRAVLKREVETRWWQGATDCGYFTDEGIPIVGFSPGEPKYSHTSRERISLELMQEAMNCFPAIISNLSKLEKTKK
jgi:putative selenium metabolism hydrolase